jgi:Thioredoxin
VLTHSIRTVIIHNFTSPKFKAPVFTNSKRAARWRARIGYLDLLLGDDHAAVTIVEYGDYECPFCAAGHPVIKRILV